MKVHNFNPSFTCLKTEYHKFNINVGYKENSSPKINKKLSASNEFFLWNCWSMRDHRLQKVINYCYYLWL